MLTKSERTIPEAMGRAKVSALEALVYNANWMRKHDPADVRELITSTKDDLQRGQFVTDFNVAHQGIHVFRPSLVLCDHLAMVRPLVTVAEYEQPFGVMIIDWPEGLESDGHRINLSVVSADRDCTGRALQTTAHPPGTLQATTARGREHRIKDHLRCPVCDWWA